MRKLLFLSLAMTFIFAACSDDQGPVGSLEVTVNLSTELSRYPTEDNTLASVPASGTAYWEYPTVGGDGIADNFPLDYTEAEAGIEDNESNDPIAEADIGNKHVYVYLYSALGDSSKDTAVLYNGESDDIDADTRTVTVDNITPGVYYVVAFYNYAYGDKVTNRLNRYDRYAIWDGTDDDVANVDSVSGGNAILDNADTVTITENETLSLEMNIHEDYVLGRPRYGNLGGQGRLFLTQSDYDALGGYPTWDGN